MLNPLTVRLFFHAIVLNMLLIHVAGARQHKADNTHDAKSPWSIALRGGYVCQLDTDLDQDGSFATSSLKSERVNFRNYTTRKAAKQDIIEWIEMFYNSKRRHSYLGYVSPREFEKMQSFPLAA